VRARGNGTNGRHGRTDHVQVNAWRRGDVLAIAMLRFGTRQLPATDEGRRFLGALVALKFPHEDMDAIAPWWRDADLVAVKRDPDRVGAAIEFEFAELKELARRGYSVRHVAPFDAQPWQVREFWDKHRRERERIRKQRERATRPPTKQEAQMDDTLKPRTKLVRAALTDQWQCARQVEDRVARQLKLDKASLNVAVGRELKLLVKRGMAERKLETGSNGRPALFVRRAMPRAHVSGQAPVVHNTL
jgi:hypothetical protein